jgi:hypothetical protein
LNCNEAEIYEAAMPAELSQMIVLPSHTAIPLVCGNTISRRQDAWPQAFQGGQMRVLNCDSYHAINGHITFLLATIRDPGKIIIVLMSNYSIEVKRY